MACVSLADAYNYIDDVELGLKYRLAAIDSILTLKPDDLSSSERLNTLKKYQLQALATSYSNLSGFYRNKLADGAKAVDYAQKALEIKKHFGKNQKYGISLFQLARAHELNKDYAKAIDCFNQALPLFSELSEKDIYQKLVLTISLGISLSFVDSKKAKAVLKESLGKMANDTMSVYLNKGDEDRMILAKNILKKL
jgi:tetratricopeptide (TPR) repeat protein